MSAAEILRACLETGSEPAWTAFVQLFQPVIASSVSRVVRRYGEASPALVDDLIQETYLRLCKDNCRVLRDFKPEHEESIFGFLKVIATSVALDHFRALSAQKRRDEIQADYTLSEPSISPASIETATLIQQLDQRLAATESERDRAIFWLHHRQGYTARDIAALPNLGLTEKGVESCLYRLNRALRGAVATTSSILKKGNSPQDTLGVMK